MSWNDFTYAMGNLSNLLNFTNGVLDKKSGQPLTTRLQDNGINLFGNTMALSTARDVRTYTGSNLGYMGFFSAKGNASEAMANTANASVWAYQNLTPMYYDNIFMQSGMYGMGGMYGMNSMYGMGRMGSMYPTTSYTTFQNPAVNRRFQGYFA